MNGKRVYVFLGLILALLLAGCGDFATYTPQWDWGNAETNATAQAA